MQLKQVDDGSIENLRAKNKQLMEVLEQNQQEIQILKSNHDSNLDQFDSKFDEVQKKVQILTHDNQHLKNKIQQQRDKATEAEQEKNYWRDKCRIAERKGDEINKKIGDLENELRTLIFERTHQDTQEVKEQLQYSDKSNHAKLSEPTVKSGPEQQNTPLHVPQANNSYMMRPGSQNELKY